MAELGANYSSEPTLGAMCVGRESELAKLGELYKRSASEGGHALLVKGPSGVGKSRLLLELKRRLRLAGVCVLEGRCRQDHTAYQPFLEVVREASGYLADLAPALFQASRSMEIIDGLSGGGMPGLAVSGGNLQSGLLPAGDPSDDGGADGDLRFARWEDRRTLLYESVGEILTTVAQVRAPVVILHDLQLADDASLRLLAHLLSTLCGSPELRRPDARSHFKGLFVLSERCSESGTAVGPRFLSGVSHTHLTLRGLDRAGVEAFLTSPDVVNRFVEVTGGNPRHLEALLEPPPSDADALLLGRVGDLPAGARQLARALAVLGRPASPRTLGRLAKLSGARLARATDQIMKADVLLSSIEDGDLKLGYKSTSDQEAIIQEMASEELSRLHSIIGQDLLARGDDVSAAEHLLQGVGDAQRAAEVALQAGERLEIAFAYDRAIDLYERASDRLDECDLLHDLQERLCHLLELTGEYERAIELTARLAERSPVEPRLVRHMGHLHLQQGDFSQARLSLERALDLLGDDSPLEEALILSDLAELAYLQGRHQEARQTVASVLDRPTADSPLPAIKARNTLGKVLLEQGDYSAAGKIFAANLEESRSANIIPEEIRALINLGISHLRQGRYAAAAECYRAGLPASESSQDYPHRAFCLQNLGVLAHWRRDYTSALQLFHDAIQTFLKLGHKSWLSWLALDLGDLHLELGDVVRAEAMLDLSASLVDAKDDSQTPLFAQVLQGKLAVFYGRPKEAEELFRTAWNQAEEAGKSDETATAALQLARARLALGDATEASAIAAAFTESPSLKTRAEAFALQGEALSIESDDLDAASRALHRAKDLYERAGDPFGIWSTLALLSQLHDRAGNSRDAAAALDKARSIEARLRKSIPPELVQGYLSHPRRSALLRLMGVDVPQQRRASDPAASGEERALPAAAAMGQRLPERDGRQTAQRSTRHFERYQRIVGESSELIRVFDRVDKIAPLDSTVLIRGESGTGKELIAEAIHGNSPRHAKPFVKVNCAALVESLLLSELFGHERGAFTGASRRKKGRFEVANGGTIFLDEIGDISPKTQVALLRVLQEKEFERVGGTAPIRVDVRIVCATHQNLERMVQDGTFREDLYYRLKAFQIEVPPLRDRASDIALLAETFLDKMADDGECPRRALSPEAAEQLQRHAWPGNVRELQNVLRSVSLLSDGETILPEDLREFLPEQSWPLAPVEPISARVQVSPTQRPAATHEAPPAEATEPESPSATKKHSAPPRQQAADPYTSLVNEGLSLSEYKIRIEQECIFRALRQTNGNITRAATLLKMKRPRLSQLVKKYGLSSPA